MKQILVIGGGASGMMAALFAAQAGARVTLLEKNEKLGKKIYITGKGRCNVTNLCDTQEFLSQVPRNPRFLYAALNTLGPQDMRDLLLASGCDTKVERGRRVFPVSDKASDVTKALEKRLHALGVQVCLNTAVRALRVTDGACTGAVLSSGAEVKADAVIVATGGVSYPSTGSTGDGLRFARETGHEVTPTRASLVGLVTAEEWCRALQGLTLKNITLSASVKGKTVYSELGEMLFTHFGISGPLALECSSHLPDSGVGVLTLDLKPGLTHEQLSARLQREFTAAGKKHLSNVMPLLLPQRMAEVMCALAGTDGNTQCCQISAAMREKLACLIKALPVTVTGLRPVEEAIVTRGGVSVRDISAGTMQSRRVSNLYFCGEALDVDAHTGGYNLQIAFSTGALAGKSAAES